MPFLNSGAIYVSGRCKSHQPIVVMRISKFIETVGGDMDFIRKSSTYLCDFISKYFFVQGKIENWFTLMDMSDVGVTQIPVNDLKTFMQHLQSNFRGRMFRTVVVFSPMMLRAIWNIVWAFIDEFVQ